MAGGKRRRGLPGSVLRTWKRVWLPRQRGASGTGAGVPPGSSPVPGAREPHADPAGGVRPGLGPRCMACRLLPQLWLEEPVARWGLHEHQVQPGPHPRRPCGRRRVCFLPQQRLRDACSGQRRVPRLLPQPHCQGRRGMRTPCLSLRESGRPLLGELLQGHPVKVFENSARNFLARSGNGARSQVRREPRCPGVTGTGQERRGAAVPRRQTPGPRPPCSGGAVRDAPLGMRFGPQTQAPSRSPLGGSPASPTTPSDAGSSDTLLGAVPLSTPHSGRRRRHEEAAAERRGALPARARRVLAAST